MKIIRYISFSLFLLTYSATAFSIVVLDVRDGQLHGATGVIVDGDSYDVSFQDGTCFDLFNGCDEPSDFPFPVVDTTPASVVPNTLAAKAAQALLDQVFLDSALGNFGSEPESIFGCTYLRGCSAYFPILATTLGGANYFTSISADVGETVKTISLTYGTPIMGDFYVGGTADNGVLAIWTGSATAPPPPIGVPEPTSIALLGLGLIGFGFRRRNFFKK